MAEGIHICYNFTFAGERQVSFDLSLDRDTLDLKPLSPGTPPDWAALDLNKCRHCSFDSAATPFCPIAANLGSIVAEFKDLLSYENVSVSVATDERTFSKDTTVQIGLSSLLGIVMATSGCPVTAYLKPMVRFHLPFATLEETVYRMASMYLAAQYFRNQEGKQAEFSLAGLAKIYENVSTLNNAFAERLNLAAKKDANVNALVNLDCFANFIMDADAVLEPMKVYWTAYLKD